MANFPSSLDSLTNPNTTDKTNNPSHAEQHSTANDILEALEAKVGIDSSAVTTSHDYKLSLVTGTKKALAVSTAGVVSQNSLVIEPTTASNDGFIKVQSGSSGDRADFQLQAKSGSNADDLFIFSLRSDLADITISAYDDSAATFHQILEFDYLDDLVKFGDNTILHHAGSYNSPSDENHIVLQHLDSSDNVTQPTTGILFEFDADAWDGTPDKHARIFAERTSDFANDIDIVLSSWVSSALAERVRISDSVTIDGLEIQDSKLVTANSVVTANYTDASILPEHLVASTGTSWAWQDFTPSFTNWTIGTGGSAVTTAKYIQIGKLVIFRITTILGSSGQSVGSGVSFNVPVTARTGILGTDNFFEIGRVLIQDAATASYWGTVRLTSTTAAQILVSNVSGTYLTGTALSSTVPHTWAAGDGMTIHGFYEAA